MKNQVVSYESDTKSSTDGKRPFQKIETDFKDRLLEAIAGEPVAAFSRRCGASESLLRNYLKNGNKPGVDHLVGIADAANVSIEWLATGRGPKQRGAPSIPTIPPAPSQVESTVNLEDLDRLELAIEAVEEGLNSLYRELPPAKRAKLIVAAYDLLIDMDQKDNVVKFIKLAA